MNKAQRIEHITPFETASMSFGLGLFMVWFAQVPSQALLPVAPILMTSFLFAFAVSCALLARTRLPGAGSFDRTIWIAPSLLLLLPPFGMLWAPLKILALLLPAFGAALLFCQWLTLCARFTPRLFLLLYCLSSLVSMTGASLITRTAPLLHSLPFLSTGLLLLTSRRRGWLPEGENYASSTLSSREGTGILVFALLMNGIPIIAESYFPQTALISSKVLNDMAMLFALTILLILLYLRKPLSYRNLLMGALGFWGAGIPLTGISVSTALFLISTGCILFECSFWMLMLQFAIGSLNPARLICIGTSLITFAMIATHTLLDLLIPIGINTLAVQSGFALFIGLASMLFIFLPRAILDVPAVASAAVSNPVGLPQKIPPTSSTCSRELRLKDHFESLGLTRQESRIALMLLDGLDDTGLCEKLFISKNTLKYHIRNINRKLGIATRRELPSLAERLLGSEPDQPPAPDSPRA